MEPLCFQPLIKRIRWGGTRLGDVLGKSLGGATDCAESWEVADHSSGRTQVAHGQYAGKALADLLQSHRTELLGRHQHLAQFPLLIKFLDANDWLSLQVHPNDAQAVTYDPSENGKTEAWIIVDAEPDSQICCGLKSGITQAVFEQHLTAGTVEETLHFMPAKVGDCVFVPAQTVHALGPGILLAEIQQQSNLTFRLHDWGRVGSDGKPREIHVKQSLECIDFDRGPVAPAAPVSLTSGNHNFEEMVRCDYFVIRRHQTVDSFALQMDNRFRILMLLKGEATVDTDGGTVQMTKGNTVVLPAALQSAMISPQNSICVLEITHP